MRDHHIKIMSEAIANRRQAAEIETTTEFRIGILIRCVELGDTQSVQIWLDRVKNDPQICLKENDKQVIEAAEYVLGCWRAVEIVHGAGALMNYKHRLNHSSATHIGVTKIENAARFQMNKPREITDLYWALEYC